MVPPSVLKISVASGLYVLLPSAHRKRTPSSSGTPCGYYRHSPCRSKHTPKKIEELMVAKKETEALRRKLFSTTMLMAKVQQRAINRNISSQLLAKLAVIVEKSKIKL